MMKRNILAVVIPALLAAGAANAAEVYNKDGNKLDLNGKIDGLHYFSKDSNNSGDQTYARLGFLGETKINSDLTGYGRFEYQFNASKTEESTGNVASSKTRYSYAGLKFANFGSLDYGRNKNVSYDGISYTDVLPEWGGDSGYTDGLTGRNSGVANYRNKDFFGLVKGLNFGLSYQSAHTDSTNVAKQTGAGWATSASYTTPFGVSAIASYAEANRTQTQVADGRGDSAEVWATGLKYDANSIYLAATYGEYRNVSYIGSSGFKNGTTRTGTAASAAFDKTQVFELVAQYAFDFGLKPSIAYVSAKAKDDTLSLNDYTSKYISYGVSYSFNKNFSTYTEYDMNLLSSSNVYKMATDDRVAVGVVYQF
ncbi:porin [Musicola paradisiaca]|uniref:Porin Gram-negative type n=1 Tax=Musicola paradisiaca (strain Ech703) TaxID=579405 RepID=C6C3T8_MUSP7|nr:porin [Musicola paradisiaca]ACS85433.1 porin Gram-negative type [Musicola paradisiaca Ech703]